MPGKKSFASVQDYLSSLPLDRRDALLAVRKCIRQNLDAGFEEGIQYGMIGYYVPHEIYPPGYHCNPREPLPLLGLGSQKNHMALHLFCLYVSEEEAERFRKDWLKTGKKLDMGKSCLRFRRIEDLPLDVLGRMVERMTVKRFVQAYETALATPRSKSSKRRAPAGRKREAAARGRKGPAGSRSRPS